MKQKLLSFLMLTAISVSSYVNAQIFNSGMSITAYGSVNSPAGEDLTKVIDGNINTKFLDFNVFDGMGFSVDLGGIPATAQSIEIITANDSPTRDGDSVEVLGSNDGINYSTITTIAIPCDTTRFYSRFFNFTNSTSYTYYRINFPTSCGSSSEMQVAEVQLYSSFMCNAPANLTVSNITSTSADLGWTDPSGSLWHIEWDTTAFAQGTGNMVVGTTNNPQNITGLTPNTTYDFYVMSDCGTDSSVWAGPYTFTTACNVFSIPFYENFSSTSTTQNCWTIINNNSDSYYWDMDYSSNTLAGDEVAVMYTDGNSGNDDDFLVSPTITLTGNEQLRFSYRVQSSSEPNDFQVTLSTSGVAPANFTNTLLPLTSASNTTYQEQTINLAAYSGNVNIAFHVPPGTTDGWRLYIDSVVIEPLPPCPAPSLLTVTNLTSTSADLGWTDPSGSLWHIEWDTSGFTQGTGNMIIGTTSNPQNITGLTPDTYYDFYVMTDCGTDSSMWAGPFTFYTGYCVPAPSSVDGNGITNVTMGSINNTTGAEPNNYGNYSAMVTNTQQGATLGIDITLETGYTYDLWAWVDWNNDLDFTDPGEEFFLGTSTSNDPTTFNGSITVPLTAPAGNHRIRIGGADNGLGTTSPSDPCYSGSYAAFEDYTLNVLPPAANDLGVISIQSTPTGCGLGMEAVTIEILNYGTSAQSGFDVAYSLNGTPITPETVSSTINSGDTLTYVFSTQANMSTPAQYTIDAWTQLGSDGVNSNDTLFGWMTEHLNNSLAYMGQDSIYDGFITGSQTSICTNGLVSGNLGSCTELSALVIDSLAHTYVGDLEIWLISPSGDSLLVSDGNGSGNDDIINVTFTDTAATNISGNTPTPGSFFHTEDTLGFSVFDGTNPEGEWKLWIMDNASGDEGNIYDWHLEFVDNSFIVNLGADTNVCDVNSLMLDAGVSGNHSYSWSTGETTQQITVDTTSLGGNGTYNIYVTVTDTISGCAEVDTIMVNFSTCTGVNTLTEDVSVIVKPNPNNGLFTLNINTVDVNELSVKIVNLQGQTVYNKTNFNNVASVNEQINLSNNANGVYFVVITTEKGIKTHKLIIQ